MTPAAESWGDLRAKLSADAARLRRFQASKFGYRPRIWFMDPAWWVVLLHRLSAFAWRRGHLKTGRFFMQLNSLWTGADIHPAAQLGPGLLIPSPCGVTLSCRAGRDLTVMALAGVGGSLDGPDIGAGPGLPFLEDNVVVGPFAGLQKAIRIGNGAVVEGGAGALKNLPPGRRSRLATSPLVADTPPAAPAGHDRLPCCPHASWARTRADLTADIDRYVEELARYRAPGRWARLSVLLTNPGLATAVYRLAHWQHASGRPGIARVLTGFNLLLNRLTITSDSCIGGGLFMPHLGGTLFCGTAGRRLTLYANSLCAPAGPATYGARAQGPLLGDDVMVAGHAAVIGPVCIGSRIRIATKLQATASIPDDVDAFTPMGRFTERREDATVSSAPRACSPQAAPPAAASDIAVPWRAAWVEAGAAWREDKARLREAAANGRLGRAPRSCVRLHRLAHALFISGRRRAARWVWLANQMLTGADISPASRIGPGLLVPHPAGVAVHATIGRNCTIMAQSCISPLVDAEGCLPPLSHAPRLGDFVFMSHHSGVYEEAVVESAVSIGPGCVVDHVATAGTWLVPRPMRLRHAHGGTDEDPVAHAGPGSAGA